MRTIKQVAERITRDPFSPENKVLSDLIVSLEREQSFVLNDLYTLSENDFDIAMVILSDWRLDRYYFGHAKLFNFSRSTPVPYDEMKLKA
jgi:hypothetical protein